MTATWNLDLPHVEKLVLLALADNANDDGDCYPSITTLTGKCSMHRATVIRSIAALEEGGHITCDHRVGRKTLYRVHPSQPATSSTEQPVAGSNQSLSATKPVAACDAPRSPPRSPPPLNPPPLTPPLTPPEPSGNRQRGSSPRPTARKRCPEEFQVTEDLRTWAAANAPGVDVEAQTAAFRDYEFRNGKTDWAATWRNWMRKAKPANGKVNGTHAAVKSRTADELEDDVIVAAVRKGLGDSEILAMDELACAPNLPARIRAKREELQRAQH